MDSVTPTRGKILLSCSSHVTKACTFVPQLRGILYQWYTATAIDHKLDSNRTLCSAIRPAL